MANPNIDQDDTAERQIAHLREEVARLSQELAEKGGSALAEARRRAATAANTVRDNPGTTATVLTAAVLVGVLVGYLLGQASAGNRRHQDWF